MERGSRPGGLGASDRRRGSARLGLAGAGLSGAQGPGRGVPSGRPRPKESGGELQGGGGSQAAGRRARGPGRGQEAAARAPPSVMFELLLSFPVRANRSPPPRALPLPQAGRTAGRGWAPGRGPGVPRRPWRDEEGAAAPLHLPQRGRPAPFHLPEPEATTARPRRRRARWRLRVLEPQLQHRGLRGRRPSLSRGVTTRGRRGTAPEGEAFQLLGARLGVPWRFGTRAQGYIPLSGPRLKSGSPLPGPPRLIRSVSPARGEPWTKGNHPQAGAPVQGLATR